MKTKSVKSSVAKSVAVVTGFSVATRFLSFLFKIYISRNLGAEAVGLYQMALSVYLLLFSFAASGLPVVLSRKIAEDMADKGKKTAGYLSAALLITATISSILIVAFYIFKSPLSALFADKRAVSLLTVMLPALVSTSVYATLRAWFWGKKSFAAFSFSEMLEEIFRIFFTVLFTSGIISSIMPLKGLALGFLLADVSCLIVLLSLFFISKGKLAKPCGAKELIKSGTPVTMMKLSGALVTSFIALVIPAGLVSSGYSMADATAMFGRVSGMAMPLLMAPTALTSSLAVVLIPEIAAASTRKDSKYMRARIEGSLNFSIFIASFFCILFMPLGVETATIVFGDAEAGMFLSNSAILLYPIGLNQLSISMLNSLGLENKTFINYLFGTIALVICIFVLPRYIGVYAIAVGCGICFTITSVLNLRILSKKVSLFDSPKKTILTICFMPPCTALAFLLKTLLLPVMPMFIAVLLSGGIPMLIYLALATAFKIVDVSRFYQRGRKFLKRRGK